MSGAQVWPNTSARRGTSEYAPGTRTTPGFAWGEAIHTARIAELEAEVAELRAAPSMAVLTLQLAQLVQRMEALERGMMRIAQTMARAE